MPLVAPDLPPSIYHEEALAEAAWVSGWQAFVLERERAAAAPAASPAVAHQPTPWPREFRDDVYPEHYLIAALVGGAFVMAGAVIGLL